MKKITGTNEGTTVEDCRIINSPEELRLTYLTDAELRREIDACEMECPEAELLFGEAERRNLDL